MGKYANDRYDLVLGRDLITKLGLDLKIWYCLFARFGLSPLNARNQVRSLN